ncbi:cell division protein CrgA [Cellulosimicrobium cellulans]|uniref:cell division protein CrgA n=1 Tax=Cellulosimicrobium cellulans TaxID=1710 RepID=UPI00365120DA
MPESKSRKKPKPQRPPSVPKPESGNPRWLVPTMLGLMLLGLAWIVLFYLSGPAQLPIPLLGAWNLGVGFAFIIAGFALTTRWK